MTVLTAGRGDVIVREGPFTREELNALPDDGRRHELLDGVLLMSPGPGARHQDIAGRCGHDRRRRRVRGRLPAARGSGTRSGVDPGVPIDADPTLPVEAGLGAATRCVAVRGGRPPLAATQDSGGPQSPSGWNPPLS